MLLAEAGGMHTLERALSTTLFTWRALAPAHAPLQTGSAADSGERAITLSPLRHSVAPRSTTRMMRELANLLCVCGLLCSASTSVHAAPPRAAAANGSRLLLTLHALDDDAVTANPTHVQAGARPDPNTHRDRHDEDDQSTGPWYGWQTLISDVLGSTLVLISGETGHSSLLGLLGAGSLLFGGPVIHAAHLNWVGFGVSLGLRSAAGLAFWGGLATVMGDGSRALGGALLVGSFLIALSAVGLDLFHFSFEEAPPAQQKSYAPLPWADPRGGAGLQLATAF